METLVKAVLYRDTPVGLLRLCADDAGVCGVYFVQCPAQAPEPPDNDLLRRTARELDEYFAGQRRAFDLPLSPHGTAFQMRVWAGLRQIPYGETAGDAVFSAQVVVNAAGLYSAQVAAMAGTPKACRAVGMANHRNPISILIPCHRVINADGGLGGYGGGLDNKRFLLQLEKGSL